MAETKIIPVPQMTDSELLRDATPEALAELRDRRLQRGGTPSADVVKQREEAARVLMDAVLLAIGDGYLDRRLKRLEGAIKARRAALPIQAVSS